MKLTNGQRKALAKVVGQRHDEKIREAKAESRAYEGIARHKAMLDLGADELMNSIKRREKEIKVFEEKLEELGFSRYGDRIIPGTEASKAFDCHMKKCRGRINALQIVSDQTIKQIWTAENTDDLPDGY